MRAQLLAIGLFAVIVASAVGTASASAATKFVVTSPTTKAAIPGKVTVSAKLKSKRSARIVSARFYANGKRITTDNRYPFKVKRRVKFDTRKLPSVKPTIRLSVVFKIRKSNGKLRTRTLKRNVRVKFFLNPTPSVGAKGIEQPQCTPSPAPEPTKFGYPLAFNDEFDCAPLNTAKWNTQRYDTLDGWTVNNPPLFRPHHTLEGAAYNPNNVAVANGALELKLEGPASPAASAEGYTRSTGMVNTKGKFNFKYGYVETRVWVSDCIGCWQTFWIMPENGTWPPEIDIFEFVNPESAQKRFPHSIVHWKPDGIEGDDQHQWAETIDGIKSQEWFTTYPAGKNVDYMGTGEWHTYGMLWTKDRADFFVDGKLGSTVLGESKLPQTPMYLIYQMAIGDPNKFPAGVAPEGSTLSVDYLRVFSSDT